MLQDIYLKDYFVIYYIQFLSCKQKLNKDAYDLLVKEVKWNQQT